MKLFYWFVLRLACLLPTVAPIGLGNLLRNLTCDPKFFGWGTLQVRTPQPGVTRLSGMVELRQPIDKNLTIENISIRTDTKLKFAVFSENLCQYLASAQKSWRVDISPQRVTCPIPKGNYSVQNFTERNSKFMSGPHGYRIEVGIKRGAQYLCKGGLEIFL